MKWYLLVTLLAANSIMVQTSDFSGLNTNGKKFDNLNGRCSALEKFQADIAPHMQTLTDLNLAEQLNRIDRELQAAKDFLNADESTAVENTEPTQPKTLQQVLKFIARSQAKAQQDFDATNQRINSLERLIQGNTSRDDEKMPAFNTPTNLELATRLATLEETLNKHVVAVTQHHAEHEQAHHDHAALANTTDLTNFRTQLTELKAQIDALTTVAECRFKRLTLKGEEDLETRLEELDTLITAAWRQLNLTKKQINVLTTKAED